MYDILRLYGGLRIRCLWRMIRELKLAAIPALLLLMLLGVITWKELGTAPVYYSVLVDVTLLLAWHLTRSDSVFLSSIFCERRTKMLFFAEYTLLSAPFLCFFLYRSAPWAVAIVLLALVIVCFLPCGGISLRLPTCPCLASGSYEYHRAARLTLPLLLPLMAAGAIGAYIGNRHLVIGVSMIAVSVFSMLMMREWHMEYLFHYKSAARFLRLKLLFALRNACIIFLPFIVCLLLVAPSWSQLLLGGSYCLGASLLLFQVEMLCFVSGGTNSGNDLISALVYVALNVIFCVSALVPQALVLSVIVSVILAYHAYLVIKKYK